MIFYHGIAGQVLHWDAREGRPSSVTSVAVFDQAAGDNGTQQSALSGSASVESDPDTIVDAASGLSQSDPTIVYLADTTGVEIGRSYVLTNPDREFEVVEVVAVDAGVSVQVRHGLRNDYESLSTFESNRVSVSFDTTWVSDQTKLSSDRDPNPGYRVRWEYVVDGTTYVHHDYFEVARYKFDHDVTPGELEQRYSPWLNSLPTEHVQDQGRRIIDKAHSTLSFDLHRFGIPGDMLRNRAVVNELVELKAVLMVESDKAKRTGETIGYEIARDEYQAALDGLVAAGKVDIADDDSGAGMPARAVSLWQK